MKELDSNFLSHLQGTAKKTICNALKIDMTVVTGSYHFTDSYKDIVVDSTTYDADGSFAVSAVRKGIGNQPDTLTITNVNDPSGSDFFTNAKAKLLEGAEVFLYLVNREDPTQYFLDFHGFVSRVKPKDFTVDLELEGLSSLLLQNIMKTYEVLCINNFGDTACGFDLSTEEVSGSVTSVTNRKQFIDNTRTEADNFFRFGKVTFSSGNNNGISREVKSYDGITKEFVFYQNFPFEIVVTDAYDATPGCVKSVETCKDDWDNYENFRGYLEKVPHAEDLTYEPPDVDNGGD